MMKGVIFDQDGILFDTEKLYGIAWRRACELMGYAYPEGLHEAVCGTSGQQILDSIHRFLPDVDPAEFRDLGFHLVIEEQHKYLPEKPGVREILAYLKEKGMKIAVASSSWRSQVDYNLTTSGLSKYFDELATGEEVLNGKPAPDIFLLAARKLGLAPTECYVFEDSPNGVRAGAAAGCATVMIPDVLPATEELRGLSKRVCKDFFEVLDLMKARNL